MSAKYQPILFRQVKNSKISLSVVNHIYILIDPLKCIKGYIWGDLIRTSLKDRVFVIVHPNFKLSF